MLAVGAAALVGEARHDRGELGRAQAVEQALAERLGEQQIGLGVEAGELLAGVGELPAVDVAPRLEHPQHPVELPGQALAAAAHAPFGALHVALEALDRRRGPQLLLELRVAAQRVVARAASSSSACRRSSRRLRPPSSWSLTRRRRSAACGGTPGCGVRTAPAGRWWRRAAAGRRSPAGPSRTTSRPGVTADQAAAAAAPVLVAEHRDPAATAPDDHDVAGSQRLDRLGDAAPAALVAPQRVAFGDERAVLLHLARGRCR